MNNIEGVYTCADGGTYTITEVGGKLLIHGRKIDESGKIIFDNVGIIETTDDDKTYTAKWKDTKLSAPNTKAKSDTWTTVIRTTNSGFETVPTPQEFADYGKLTKKIGNL